MKQQIEILLNKFHELQGLLDMASENPEGAARLMSAIASKAAELSAIASDASQQSAIENAVADDDDWDVISYLEEEEEVATEPEPIEPEANDPESQEPEKEEPAAEEPVAIEETPAEEKKPDIAMEPVSRPVARPNIRILFNINDRFRFRKELFGGNDKEFTDALDLVSRMANIYEAEDWFFNDLQWSQDNRDVKDFMKIIENYFSL